MINKKFELYKEPYIRKADFKYYGTKNIMIDFVISLLPIILIGWYQNGIKVFNNNKSLYSFIYPLLFIITGCLFSYFTEFIYFSFKNKKIDKSIFLKVNNSYAFIPGLLLSLILPLKTPIWVLLIGCIFSTVIGKLLFGGFGHNIFNPALVGYIFVMTAFYSVIYSNNIDIISSVSPLNELKNMINNNLNVLDIIDKKTLLNICFGLKSGTIAETSSVACFISFIYLIIRKVINYKITIICLLTFFISSIFIGFLINDNGFIFAIYNLFSGGIIFGSIFMVTEPVTSPRSVYGKYIYAFFIAIIALMLRLLSDLEDGTSTAILFMNMLAIIIDSFGAKLRVEKQLMKKISKVFLIFFIYICITSYCVIKINSKTISNTDEFNIELVNIEQDYNKLINKEIEFIYSIKINDKVIKLNCDKDGNILSNFKDLQYFELIKELIYKNRINRRSTNPKNHKGYISDVKNVSDNNYVITGKCRGYTDEVIIVINYINNEIITIDVDISKETDLKGGLEQSDGSIEDLINIGKGNRSDVVSNVTYTSISLITCRNTILEYINLHLGGNNE